MNVAYINPFIAATHGVFSSMVHVSIVLGRPRLRQRDDPISRLARIAAVIGLSGAVQGMVALALPERVALALASGLAGTAMSELDQECCDALAELVNMIAGSAKKDLPGGLITMSLPTLLPATDVVYPKNLPIVDIPFDTGVGRFLIEVAFREVEAAAA